MMSRMTRVRFSVPYEYDARVRRMAPEQQIPDTAMWRQVVSDGLNGAPDYGILLEKLILVNSLTLCLLDRMAGEIVQKSRSLARKDIFYFLKELDECSPPQFLRYLTRREGDPS